MNPRLRDLPERERELFSQYLRGQTVPVDNPAELKEEWDWYYQYDYDQWYQGCGVWD